MKKGSWVLVLVFLLGLALVLYPAVSDAVNRAGQGRVLESYADAAAALDGQQEALFSRAEAYNALIRADSKALFHPDQFPGYGSLLDIDGTGVMGYVSIPRIRVTLPIYHGTQADALQVGVGHLEGTSLPVGGPGTHTVLSAHRGLPSAKLFTNLDQLEEGDTFQITVLNRTMTYQVDKISIVLPSDTRELAIAPEEDYATLMTCTPYGINTHRLLVRGRRVDDSRKIQIFSEAYQVKSERVTLFLAIPAALIVLLAVFLKERKRK